jgi:conserved repeat domain
LLYEVAIWNEGTIDATGVTFSDTPDPNTALVVGSVTTTKGNVITGNTPGDSSVEVDVGTLQAGGPVTETVTISFNVTINDPLPAGVTHVYNQGLLYSNEVAPEPTDDPGTPQDNDPTDTLIQGAEVPPPPPPPQAGGRDLDKFIEYVVGLIGAILSAVGSAIGATAADAGSMFDLTVGIFGENGGLIYWLNEKMLWMLEQVLDGLGFTSPL